MSATIKTPDRSVTQTLAAAVVEAPAASIAPAALDAAQRLLVDHVGITYMGVALTGGALLAYARDLGGRPDAILIGGGARVPAEVAAGINGQLCRATNFEDSGPGRHAGPMCVHTALAVGQRAGASGADVLAAIALGYALCARFQFAEREPTGYAYHRVTAAAVAARLLGLDVALAARALSLAWEMPHRAAIGTPRTFLPKRISPLGTPGQLATPLFHARAGVQAAVMAQHGFESVLDELDMELDRFDRDVLTAGLQWNDVVQMELKPWPCVRPGQCAIQALEGLVAKHDPDLSGVRRLSISVPGIATVPHQNEPTPATMWEAIYSLQWAAVMVLRRMSPGPQWFAAEQLSDPLNRRLLATIVLEEDRDSSLAYREGRRAAVNGTAVLESDAGTYRETCSLGETRGSPGAEMSSEEAKKKFMAATSLCLDPARGERVFAALADVAGFDDVNDLAAML